MVCRQGHVLSPQKAGIEAGAHTGAGIRPQQMRGQAVQQAPSCVPAARWLLHVWVATHPVAGRINKGDESEAVKIHFLSISSPNQATKGGILARMREEKAEGSECYRKHQ